MKPEKWRSDSWTRERSGARIDAFFFSPPFFFSLLLSMICARNFIFEFLIGEWLITLTIPAALSPLLLLHPSLSPCFFYISWVEVGTQDSCVLKPGRASSLHWCPLIYDFFFFLGEGGDINRVSRKDLDPFESHWVSVLPSVIQFGAGYF